MDDAATASQAKGPLNAPEHSGRRTVRVPGLEINIGAEIITNMILRVPYCN